jgi:hypothetical protein
MAENKKSFLIYTDWIHPVEKIDDETAGKLFKHLMRFVNDKNPVSDELIVEVLFEAWKPQLKRDLDKWKAMVSRNQKIAESRKRKSDDHSLPLDTDNDNDIDKDIDNDSNSLINRKARFGKSLKSFKSKYSDKDRGEFFEYWTEHNTNGKKMRFEYAKNQPFNMGRRLGTWMKNVNNGNKKNTSGNKGGTTRQDFD